MNDKKPHDLSGDWNGAFIRQNGSQINIEPDWTKINRATAPWTNGTGTLNGDALTVTFTGGRARVPVTYTANVAFDGQSISWSNGGYWTKKLLTWQETGETFEKK